MTERRPTSRGFSPAAMFRITFIDRQSPRREPAAWQPSMRRDFWNFTWVKLTPEHEIDSANHAEPRPEVIQLERLFEIKNRKGSEQGKRDDFLRDLQLSYAQPPITDSVRRHLEQILKKRNPPAYERRDVPLTIT